MQVIAQKSQIKRQAIGNEKRHAINQNCKLLKNTSKRPKKCKLSNQKANHLLKIKMQITQAFKFRPFFVQIRWFQVFPKAF